jgi:hypothetical protein
VVNVILNREGGDQLATAAGPELFEHCMEVFLEGVS